MEEVLGDICCVVFSVELVVFIEDMFRLLELMLGEGGSWRGLKEGLVVVVVVFEFEFVGFIGFVGFVGFIGFVGLVGLVGFAIVLEFGLVALVLFAFEDIIVEFLRL